MSENRVGNHCNSYACGPVRGCGTHPSGVDHSSAPEVDSGQMSQSDQVLTRVESSSSEAKNDESREVMSERGTQEKLSQRLKQLAWQHRSIGQCPRCDHPIDQTETTPEQWECEWCGWSSDAG